MVDLLKVASLGITFSAALVSCGPAVPPNPTATSSGGRTAAPAPSAQPALCRGGMMLVPGGRFLMSTGKSATPTTVAAFCLDVTEVTVRDYKECRGCTAPDPASAAPHCNWGASNREDHPVNCVTWSQASRYCSERGQRLPTEAEWMYAARGGAEQRAYPWGSALPTDAVLCWNRLAKSLGTCPVSEHPMAAFGLHGMAGNVAEWVQDRQEAAPGEQGPESYDGEPTGPRWMRVARGGYWATEHATALLERATYAEDRTGDDLGFRCASDLPPR